MLGYSRLPTTAMRVIDHQGELNPGTRALLVDLRGGFVNRYKSR